MSLSVDIRARRGAFTLEAAFEAGAGVTCLFGRSGAGKTSLAEAVGGFLRPDRGRIALAGEVLFDHERAVELRAWRRRIGWVFQEPRLFPHLSVRANLLYGAPAGADPAPEIGLLGLEALLDRRPAGLSGGEARRVAIGRALISRPRLLILDEPLTGLDGARRLEVLAYLEALAHTGGPPMLYVSHSVEEVTRLADRVVLMSAGRVLGCGSPAEVFDHPEAEAAAGLAAPISILEGRVAEAGSEHAPARLALGSADFRVTGLQAAAGTRARAVVDSRDVVLALSDPQGISLQNRLPATITGLESRAGGAVLVRLEAPGLKLKSMVTQRAVQDLDLRPGLSLVALVKATAASRVG